MKKTAFAWLLILLLSLSGCRLAREEGAQAQSHDRLVGVFVTEEHLDLFDFEAYFQDHANALISGGKTVIEDTQGYEQRIYANMEKGGCVFEGLDGILFASYAFREENVSGYRNAPENRVSGQVSLEESETDTVLSMDGTIYISDKIGYAQYFYNPVWQDGEGRVYLTAGTGLSSNVTEGMGMKNWHDISDEFSLTVNGQTQSYRADIRIAIEAITLPERCRICYMDENHQKLAEEIFTPEEMPPQLTPPESTAYLVLEGIGQRKDGTEFVSRQIFSREEDAVLEIYIPEENHICIKSNTQILW